MKNMAPISRMSASPFGRTLDVLCQQFVEELLGILRTVPLTDFAHKSPRTPRESVKMTPSRLDPKLRGAMPHPTIVVEPEGEHFVAHTPDGRTFRSKRSRDVIRRLRQEGLAGQLGP